MLLFGRKKTIPEKEAEEQKKREQEEFKARNKQAKLEAKTREAIEREKRKQESKFPQLTIREVITREEITSAGTKRIAIHIGKTSFSKRWYFFRRGGYFNDPNFHEIGPHGERTIYHDINYSEPLDPKTGIISMGSQEIENDYMDIMAKEQLDVAELSALVIDPRTIKIMFVAFVIFLGFGLMFNPLFNVFPPVVVHWVP